MTKRLTLIFVLLTLLCQGQKKGGRTQRKDKSVNPLSFDVYYGYSLFSKNFYDQFNTIDNPNFDLPIRQLGIGYTNYDFASNPNHYLSHQMGLTFILPNKITINDTVRSDVSGFNYSFGLGKAFFRKVKYFKFNVYLGFNTGRTTLTNQDHLNFKNPFFAPKILIQPKVIIKRFCFSLLFNYSYDISKTNWKQMTNSNVSYSLDKFDQTNYTLMVSFGYCPF